MDCIQRVENCRDRDPQPCHRLAEEGGNARGWSGATGNLERHLDQRKAEPFLFHPGAAQEQTHAEERRVEQDGEKAPGDQRGCPGVPRQGRSGIQSVKVLPDSVRIFDPQPTRRVRVDGVLSHVVIGGRHRDTQCRQGEPHGGDAGGHQQHGIDQQRLRPAQGPRRPEAPHQPIAGRHEQQE